jgi:hypothetical protein
MDTRELRLGNLVFDNEDRSDARIFKVERIDTPEYAEWNDGEEYNAYVSILGKTCKDGIYSLKPSPIPLNEEWLLKMGFEEKYPEWIKFVHELQNWYYYNHNKKELEVK